MYLHTLKLSFIFACLLACSALSNFSHAQGTPPKNDVIIRRDSTRIQASIIRITYEKINYRDLATPDSVRKFIHLDDVARVVFRSGKILHVRDSVLATRVAPDTIGQYADMKNLPSGKFAKSVVMANSDQLRDKYRYHSDKAADGKTGSIVFTSIGVAGLISGILIAGAQKEHDDKVLGNSLAIAGAGVGGLFGIVCYRNYKLHQGRARQVRNELERRGQPLSLHITPGFYAGSKSARLALQLNF